MKMKNYSMDPNEFLLLAEEQSSAFINDLELNDSGGKTREGLKFHISSDDYFGTLASIMRLLMDEKLTNSPRHKEALQKIADDLIFLQKNYKIAKK